MQDFEKLGLFYLGKIVNRFTKKLGNDLLLYDSKNLTTHAVCVGMTGSGKIGLSIAMLEETASNFHYLPDNPPESDFQGRGI